MCCIPLRQKQNDETTADAADDWLTLTKKQVAWGCNEREGQTKCGRFLVRPRSLKLLGQTKEPL